MYSCIAILPRVRINDDDDDDDELKKTIFDQKSKQKEKVKSKKDSKHPNTFTLKFNQLRPTQTVYAEIYWNPSIFKKYLFNRLIDSN